MPVLARKSLPPPSRANRPSRRKRTAGHAFVVASDGCNANQVLNILMPRVHFDSEQGFLEKFAGLKPYRRRTVKPPKQTAKLELSDSVCRDHERANRIEVNVIADPGEVKGVLDEQRLVAALEDMPMLAMEGGFGTGSVR